MSGDKEKKAHEWATRNNGPPLAVPATRQQHHLDLVGERIADPERKI